MCGRVTLLTLCELSEVLRAIELRNKRLPLIERFEDAGTGRAQARPGSLVDALTLSGDTLAIASLTWGFDSPGKGGLVFNTRIESALGRKRLWAKAIEEGRCILPVASFFEPHATQTVVSPRTGHPMKRQFEFASPDGTALLLACVHDAGRLSVVTTEPSESVAPVHHRMPLVVGLDEVAPWLTGDYAALADRSGIRLSAAPERLPATAPSPQLSLF